jgi:hypothetical protein
LRRVAERPLPGQSYVHELFAQVFQLLALPRHNALDKLDSQHVCQR